MNDPIMDYRDTRIILIYTVRQWFMKINVQNCNHNIHHKIRKSNKLLVMNIGFMRIKPNVY